MTPDDDWVIPDPWPMWLNELLNEPLMEWMRDSSYSDTFFAFTGRLPTMREIELIVELRLSLRMLSHLLAAEPSFSMSPMHSHNAWPLPKDAVRDDVARSWVLPYKLKFGPAPNWN